MLLIDALYVNSGGGKILLDYLIENIERTDFQVYYLLDKRVEGKVPYIKPENKVLYLAASFYRRGQFYQRHKKKFNRIFCFGNLPPNIKVDGTVYTYFHQLMFLSIPGDISFKMKLLLLAKKTVLGIIKKNTSYWVVQSQSIKDSLSIQLGISPRKIIVLPFYRPFKVENSNIRRKKNTFLYVSNATPNKNYERLIEGFCHFYDENSCGDLIVTVDKRFENVYALTAEKIQRGYPIKNIGFVSTFELQEFYLACEYLIFPSLSESLGLGIVEAIDSGCKVLGADLPYMHAVCNPSLVFDPFSVQEITQAFKIASNSELKPSQKRIDNKIQELLHLLNV